MHLCNASIGMKNRSLYLSEFFTKLPLIPSGRVIEKNRPGYDCADRMNSKGHRSFTYAIYSLPGDSQRRGHPPI